MYSGTTVCCMSHLKTLEEEEFDFEIVLIPGFKLC